MISIWLLIYCLIFAGGALFVFELIWYVLERQLNLLDKVPKDILEDSGMGYFFSKFIMQFAFMVALPSVLYSWVYVLIPFYGIRAGIAIALFLFMLGIVPYSIALLMRVKLPMAYTLFQMTGYLLKLILVYGIIGYIYVL